jgi:hypothetical protein
VTDDLRQTALDLFDDLLVDPEAVAEAIAATDEAVDRAYTNTEADWKIRALEAVETIARRREEFTADAVWALLERWEVPPPHQPTALGGVMRAVKDAGWIEPTERFNPSVRPQHHRYPCRVWRSLIVGQVAA